MKSLRADPAADESLEVPLFGTWRKAYAFVVAAFIFDVTLFYLIGRYFS